jgi:hypothetical protein
MDADEGESGIRHRVDEAAHEVGGSGFKVRKSPRKGTMRGLARRR